MSQTNKESGAGHGTRRVKTPAASADLPDLPNLPEMPDFGEMGREAAEHVSSMLAARVRDDPYATLGIAVGFGLLIGGGMWRLVARSVVGLGTRVVLGAVTSSILARTLPSHSHQQEPRP